MFQQLCTGSSGREKERWRKSKLKCRRRNNEASGQQLLRLPDHGWSRHTVTKYITDEKTHAAIISKLFKKPDRVANSMNEFEIAKAQIEHKEPIIVRFFILH